jgi:hypothetical protein
MIPYIGQVWLLAVDTQASLIKDEEFDDFIEGKLQLKDNDPRLKMLTDLDDTLGILEERMINDPAGKA